MDFKVGYDCDGVLAVAPPDGSKPWRHMKGDERLARKADLLTWYKTAGQLMVPKETLFVVITARKNSDEIRQITTDWLYDHLPGATFILEMLPGAKSLESVIEFKTGVIQRYGLKDYTEDNRPVVNALRKTCPTTRVWHFKNGQQILDYQGFPVGS